MKTFKRLGQEAFDNNENNFFKRIRQIIREDESPFDETTTVTVRFNFHDGCEPYFQFQINTERMDLTTDYYRYDYNFKEGRVNNLDELNVQKEDEEIYVFLGSEIPLN